MEPLFRTAGEKLECLLCPHFCKIAPGHNGICGVRKNNGKSIELLTYGVISGYSLDPLEKKPLYHFFPGYNVLSAGSYGCNLKCDFCQNCTISQIVPDKPFANSTPGELVIAAQKARRNIGLAFTYNEPVIWFEFIRDTAEAAKKEGLKTVMVSNGYVNPAPLEEIIEFTDAFNIDLKAFNDNFYRKVTGSRIEPVKNTLRQIAKSGRHLEITTLIIPGLNDESGEMKQQVEWIAGELGIEIPFHLSRYYPMYHRSDPATSSETLSRLYEIASEKLDFVYIGNSVSDVGQNTACPQCGEVVTIRTGYRTRLLNLSKEGMCLKCGKQIYRNFIPSV
jgi:pyruvate formate lyase activating enzyme